MSARVRQHVVLLVRKGIAPSSSQVYCQLMSAHWPRSVACLVARSGTASGHVSRWQNGWAQQAVSSQPPLEGAMWGQEMLSGVDCSAGLPLQPSTAAFHCSLPLQPAKLLLHLCLPPATCMTAGHDNTPGSVGLGFSACEIQSPMNYKEKLPLPAGW